MHTLTCLKAQSTAIDNKCFHLALKLEIVLVGKMPAGSKLKFLVVRLNQTLSMRQDPPYHQCQQTAEYTQDGTEDKQSTVKNYPSHIALLVAEIDAQTASRYRSQ